MDRFGDVCRKIYRGNPLFQKRLLVGAGARGSGIIPGIKVRRVAKMFVPESVKLFDGGLYQPLRRASAVGIGIKIDFPDAVRHVDLKHEENAVEAGIVIHKIF